MRTLPSMSGNGWTRAQGLRVRVTAVFVLTVLALLALAASTLPSTASAAETSTTAIPTTTTPTTTTPAVQPAPNETSAPAAPTTTPTTSTPAPATAGQPTTPAEPTEAAAGSDGGPQVEQQHAQSVTPGARVGKGAKHAQSHGEGAGADGSAGGQTSKAGSASEGEARAGHRAPSPSTLTPSLPLDLAGPLPGVSGFFVESFQVPPFLLPIYQAAGTAYGIPWQVLAAINEVETDYGRDLSVSSAGAEGWMQFLPSTWQTYGVDANGDGFEDPYNPADAIFAAARYLRAAGGDKSIKAAIYSYNHSQAYVDSVMLRAQLLGATPPELLGAITGLTESRFPVHAPSHFGDGFMTVPGQGSAPARTIAGTTIYSQVGAPVIAVQDGEIVQIGDSPSLGRFVALRDGYGNTYIYAELGSVASLYPVLAPREHTTVSPRIDQSDAAAEPAPSSPATAGAQPRAAISEGATVSGFALGATAGFEPAPVPPQTAATPPPTAHPASRVQSSSKTRAFRSGPDEVYLHTLAPGVQVLAGTVLGHVGTQSVGASDPAAGVGAGSEVAGTAAPTLPGTSGAPAGGPRMFFQIKPAGVGAPLIDPKPILDGWVALENTSIFRAKGENPFLATSPTVGQVLLESKEQLQQQVVRDASIHMRACERQDIQAGRVDKAVLAMLEYLSVSALKPTVAGIRCAGAVPASEGNASTSSGDTVRITAVNGIPIADHQGPGSIADTTIRKLLTLQGLNRPRRIVSLTSIPGAASTVANRRARDYIRVVFGPRGAPAGHAASVNGPPLNASEWIKLVARLGEIPDPTVSSGPSTAAIPDKPGTAAATSRSAAGSASPTGAGAAPGSTPGDTPSTSESAGNGDR